MIYRFVGGPWDGRHVAIPLAWAEAHRVFEVPVPDDRPPSWTERPMLDVIRTAPYRLGPPIVGRSVATYVGPPALQSPTSCPKT